MSDDDIYNYSGISEESKKIVINELNEKPDQVNAHIESFRRWVLSMKHLKCPTDSKFLLRFLRVAKFDHSKAQKRLDNFCTIRSSPRGAPQHFKYYDFNDPVFQKFIDSGMHLPLGFNDIGQYVLMVRTKAWDPVEVPLPVLFKCIFMDMDYIISHEQVQINGISFFVDLEGMGRKAFESWADPKATKEWNKIFQDSYPMRMKCQVVYKEPAIFDIVFQIVSFFMNDKMKSRFVRAKNDINKAIEKIPGLDKLLPKEYGGKGGEMVDIIGKLKKNLGEYFKNGDPLKCISVDESKRPPETLKNLREYADYDGPTLGTAGTFTKYENVY